jgi:gamma-polyglutamate biosynthesis protein CapA
MRFAPLKISIILIFLLTAGFFFLAEKPKQQPKAENQKQTETQRYITSTKDIFETVDSNIEMEKQSDEISIISTGDVMLGRAVNIKTIGYKDFTWAFKNIKDTIKNADLAIINLETPLFSNCPKKNDGMIFCASDQHIEGLKTSGIDAASLSNNHTFNYGQKGVNDTQRILETNDIIPFGMQNPHYITGNDFKIALLGYNQIECTQIRPDCIDLEKIKNEIKIAKGNSDFIIMMFHWGNEYQNQPTNFQKELAHKAIDAGADLILGNHPHWIQPLEIYSDKLIVYSHGNTIFDQMWSQKTREGILVETSIHKSTKKITNIKIYPTLIEDYGQPKIHLKGSGDYQKQIQYIKQISLSSAK